MISRIMLRGATAAIAIALTTAPAYAGSSESLLKRLHEKGILTDEEYQALLAEEAKEAVATPAPAQAAVPASFDPDKMVKMTDSGIGLQVGPATIRFSGSVNGFYVHDDPQTPGANTDVAGGIVNVADTGSSAIRNGLLPGFLVVNVSTQQAGWDVGATFGMYPGINSNSWVGLGANSPGQPKGLTTAGIDFRQTFMTFGRKGVGTFKIGRDIGLFGSDAILNDITLLSSGPTGGNVAPSNTTLGRIGSGYIYTDFQPQITYTTPSFGGVQASVGVFQPLTSLTLGVTETQKAPGFQGKITYDGSFGGVTTHLWTSAISQKHDMVTGDSYTGKGIDAGAKLSVGPLTAVGYWYTASGLGTTALGLLDADSSGNTRDSDGFYLQAMATFGKISVGGSYGESRLDFANDADAVAIPNLVDTNSSWVGQVRYGLTPWVTLIGEYIRTKSEAHDDNKAESDAIALGGIMFF
ncbi:porin [Croceicoccus bisphenolivorans]|uniref:porin n=1 Tax=Croceicoccus bisphenolivorans TaxID=1783232 RepID=UPI00082F902B|nr:porin [Croceicoccus bisphenolivorans]